MSLHWLGEISVILTTSGADMIQSTIYGHIFIWIWRHSRFGVSVLVPQCLKQFSLIMREFNAGRAFKVTTISVSEFNRAHLLKLIEYFQSVMGDYVSRASLTNRDLLRISHGWIWHPIKQLYVITHPFHNFSSGLPDVEVWTWVSNFILHQSK